MMIIMIMITMMIKMIMITMILIIMMNISDHHTADLGTGTSLLVHSSSKKTSCPSPLITVTWTQSGDDDHD